MTDYDPHYVSQKVFARVGQKIILHDDHGNILLIKRSSKSSHPNRWDLPGGWLEQNEDPFAGIKREVQEETGLELEGAHLLTAASDTTGDDFRLILCYEAKTNGRAVTLSWEHEDFKWVTKKEALNHDLSPIQHLFLESFS